MNKITISGTDYTLKFGFNSLIEMEDDTGVPMEKMSEVMGGLKVALTMFTYAIKHQVPDITTTQAGDLIDAYLDEGGTIDKLSETLKKAMERFSGGNAMPKKK
ncbi:hypothetical protein QT711_03090 [Sporosarcina saromensis]|uniref:Phage tail assembly chaperone protein, TAC n=1 Tax=Sporosarcina saromensis TaxID=359365 RepID=A0ABU4G5B1_9BACL|nr:hypothetical protein [Sporosarcina saromensis]MDW0112155.1 hypothetical protein [Sporosarcina saromensis]